MTDIEKAFLYVYLAKEDRHYTYFLWLSNPDDPESQFTIYHFRVVLFGSVSSPFMLNAILQLILNKDGLTTFMLIMSCRDAMMKTVQYSTLTKPEVSCPRQGSI